jgi:hypothetical protein
MSAPPYLVACVMVLLSAWISDKYKCRGYVNAFNFALAVIGFVVLETTSTSGARYIGTFLAAAGAFPAIAITIAWNSNNIQGSQTKRAVGIALQSSAGSFGGVIGSFVFIEGDGPQYRKGHAVMITLNALSFVCKLLFIASDEVTLLMVIWLKYENKKLAQIARRRGVVQSFRYMI